MAVARILACAALAGCQVLSGLDEDRPADVSCTTGAKRCNVNVPEVCSDNGSWQPSAACSAACIAGECRQLVVTGGTHHTCVRLDDGTVRCWGRNDLSQVGIDGGEACPTETCVPNPVTLDALSDVGTLAAMGDSTCAMTAGGVRCWGYNSHGQLGVTPGGSSATPLAPGLVDTGPIAFVDSGGGRTGPLSAAHGCALSEAGALYCWGANCAGQLGLGVGFDDTCPSFVPSCPPGDVPTNQIYPARVNLDFRPIQVSLGAAHTCALSDTGNVYCWGLNYFEQAGVPNPTEVPCALTPHRVAGVERIVQIACGSLHTCALRDDGVVLCWGRTDKGVLGTLVAGAASRGPAPVPGISDAVEISGGYGTHVCVRHATGDVSCWGGNETGEAGIIDTHLPDGQVEPATAPPTRVALPGVRSITLDVGGNHSCTWSDAHELWCWGQQSHGNLGTGSTGVPSEPVQVLIP